MGNLGGGSNGKNIKRIKLARRWSELGPVSIYERNQGGEGRMGTAKKLLKKIQNHIPQNPNWTGFINVEQ